MGAAAQILLVSLLLATTSAWAQATRANDADYRAFWLWSGVRPSAALREAEVIYLHQGDVVTRQGKPAFVRLGQPVARLRAPALWLTVRLERSISAMRRSTRWPACPCAGRRREIR